MRCRGWWKQQFVCSQRFEIPSPVSPALKRLHKPSKVPCRTASASHERDFAGGKRVADKLPASNPGKKSRPGRRASGLGKAHSRNREEGREWGSALALIGGTALDTHPYSKAHRGRERERERTLCPCKTTCQLPHPNKAPTTRGAHVAREFRRHPPSLDEEEGEREREEEARKERGKRQQSEHGTQRRRVGKWQKWITKFKKHPAVARSKAWPGCDSFGWPVQTVTGLPSNAECLLQATWLAKTPAIVQEALGFDFSVLRKPLAGSWV